MPSEEVFERANRLLEMRFPGADEFTQAWSSFNACYNEALGGERSKVMKTVKLYITDGKAELIINSITDNIQFFTELPPGDTRKSPYHSNFRQQSTSDLIVVNDNTNTYSDRLANLASVLYTVRCSLIHGSKHPDSTRDKAVVENSIPALNLIVRAVIDGIKETRLLGR
jgi:hypothetical protein